MTTLSRAIVLTLLLTAAFPNRLRAQEKPTRAQLQELYVAFLGEEGFKPELDGDGDVRFKSEGKSMFIRVGERDPQFFSVVLPNIWPIESEDERRKVLVSADRVTANMKVVKVYTVKDNVWVSFEILVAKPEGFKPLFARSLILVNDATRRFVEEMRK